jgi:hypothetical protein
MKHRVFGWMVIAASLVGCAQGPAEEPQELVEEHANTGTSESALTRDPSPNICWGSCPRTPDFEPLGQICWLDRQACLNGILTCYYHCEPVESEFTRY